MIRYEYHPALASTNGLVGNFDPSVPLSGKLIYQDGYASTLSVEELANVNACSYRRCQQSLRHRWIPANGAPCTPVVSNSQAGLPSGLRNAPKLCALSPGSVLPIVPFGNDRTAIRGGVGYYNITTTGALFYATEQTLQSNFQTFTNTYSAHRSGLRFSQHNIEWQYVRSQPWQPLLLRLCRHELARSLFAADRFIH